MCEGEGLAEWAKAVTEARRGSGQVVSCRSDSSSGRAWVVGRGSRIPGVRHERCLDKPNCS